MNYMYYLLSRYDSFIFNSTVIMLSAMMAFIMLYQISGNYIFFLLIAFVTLIIYIWYYKKNEKIVKERDDIEKLLKEILTKDLSEQEIRKKMEEDLKLLPPNEDERKKVTTTPDGRSIHKKKNIIPAHKIKVPKK